MLAEGGISGMLLLGLAWRRGIESVDRGACEAEGGFESCTVGGD